MPAGTTRPRSQLRLAGLSKRHYTFARLGAAGSFQRLPDQVNFRLQCIEFAGNFAPFVYRSGRHPFTVERAVRFR
jgi:hypothetical protein